ncbi:MAG: hypothetical protein NTZ47_06845 [Bacteroidetes bacterium]|nr:hypothetical protein [Bacteroidota bacterium]
MNWSINFNKILNYIDCIGLAIPLCLLIIYNRRVFFPGKKAVIIYYSIFFGVTVWASFLSAKGLYNNWVYDTLPLFLSYPLFFFFRSIPQSVVGARLSLAGLLLLNLIYLLSWESAIDIPLNTEYYLYLAIFILFNAAGYLLQELRLMREGTVFGRTEFWFVATLFFYSSVCTLLWSLFKYVSTRPPIKGAVFEVGNLWGICHNSTLFFSCFIFSTVIYLRRSPDYLP